MAGYVFAVVTRDPVSNEPTGLQADLDWNLGMAVLVADSVHGEVVAAPRGEWQQVPAAVVEQVREANRQQQVDDEMRRMAQGEERGDG